MASFALECKPYFYLLLVLLSSSCVTSKLNVREVQKVILDPTIQDSPMELNITHSDPGPVGKGAHLHERWVGF